MPYRDRLLRGSRAHREICRISAAVIAAVVLGGDARTATTEDARDIEVIVPALNGALESERSGKEIPWSNPATGRAGTIRIERTFYRGQQPCRDYVRTTTGNGPGYHVRGVGCRVGKLNWAVEETRVDDPPATPASPSAASGAKPAEPDPKASATPASPSGGPSSARPPRKPAAPQPPTLRYNLPTRSQL